MTTWIRASDTEYRWSNLEKRETVFLIGNPDIVYNQWTTESPPMFSSESNVTDTEIPAHEDPMMYLLIRMEWDNREDPIELVSIVLGIEEAINSVEEHIGREISI